MEEHRLWIKITDSEEGGILETDRLKLRRMKESDYDSLCLMLRDEEVMYAYEHAFDAQEAHEWLTRQLDRYKTYGFGLWSVILKETGEMIGQCGITMQDCDGRQVMEVGYLFRKEFWHQGFASEAAKACKEYAFDELGAEEIYSIIRVNNSASRAVAERNGMTVRGSFVKHYYGMDMEHLIYAVEKA